MKGYKAIIALFLIIQCVGAQYWFQSGARGGQSSQFNSGASVTIQTFIDNNTGSGSIAFWVGEDLQNGAFLQTGYVIENQSGRYPTYCDMNGCSQYEYISAGAPEWFYEYFPPGNSNNFLGAVGPNDSAGANGTFHTYGFHSQGSNWTFTFDGANLGKINLGANTSGYNDVVAFGEVANTSGTNTYVSPVKFYNLSIYRFGNIIPAPTGFSYIGYGVGSQSLLSNPYGVEEIGSRANAFEVGSGLQEPRNDYPLWQSSFSLSVQSKYGNVSGNGLYIASRTVSINAPSYVYFANNTREAFTGWTGSGAGSYTGIANSTVVLMYGNISETANWQLQYLVNVTSLHSTVHGNGWYPANAIAYYTSSQNVTYESNRSRFVFDGWFNGTTNQSGKVKVTKPQQISAIWEKQYLVNATAQYGNVTGTGWYEANTIAIVTAEIPYINRTSTQRTAFYSWSDGNRSVSHYLKVTKPYSLYGTYKNQFIVNLHGVDQSGAPVPVYNFYINNLPEGNQTYLFSGETYTATGAIYEGSILNISQKISINQSKSIAITLPLYDVRFAASDVFGVPVSMPILIKFSNGTSTNAQLNQSGIIINNVPYGRAVASAHYLGLNLSTKAQYGTAARFTVVSATDIEIFGGILIFAFAMYYLSSRHVIKAHQIRPMHMHQ